MTTWWNVVQALAWIATRDERIVDRVRIESGVGDPDRPISNTSLDDAERRIHLEAAYAGSRIYVDAWEARDAIGKACESGKVTVRGRLRGKGDPEPIPRNRGPT
jgi:hypothetical protein